MSLLAFIALLSLGTSIEDWRGEYAWAAVVQAHIERGDPLDVLPPPPAPIPVAENFFGYPMLTRLYFAKSTNSEIVALARSVPVADHTVPLKWTEGEHVDLAVICALIAEKYPQQKWPAHLEAEPPTTRLLAHLGGANHFLAELRHSALYRTQSQPIRSSPTRLENIFKTEIPSLKFCRFTTQILSLHACASLATSDTRTAFADTLAGLQFSRGVAASSDTLVEAMIAAVIVKPAIQPVWEGIHAHTWSEAQLARFQTTLVATDIFSALHRGLIIDRNGTLALLPSRLPLIPHGWTQQNQAYYAERSTTNIDAAASHTSPAFLPNLNATELREKKFSSSFAGHPYHIFAHWALISVTKVTRYTAFSANAVTLAFTACALERHRLAHDAYPESLTQLVPAFLPAIPLDVINGDPLHYHLSPDGTFTLYSVGLDGDDDHGRRAPTNSANPLDADGDWAW
jgi:hypothetical protein